MSEWSATKVWFCFACSGQEGRPAAQVWLGLGNGLLLNTNVVPQDNPALSIAEYNRVLSELVRDYIEPAARQVGSVRVEFSPAELEPEDVFPLEAALALRNFVGRADLLVGANAPGDRGRWETFIIAAHRQDGPTNSAFLGQWLESAGWPASVAQDFAARYEEARSLLRKYDQQPQHA